MPRPEKETERIVVPVIAEHAHVEKRVIPRGGVRVTKHVEEFVQRVDVPLTKDDVDVERRAINRVFDERPEARVEGDTTIVPVVEEIVQRRFLVREEVRIARRHTAGRAVADISLAREQAAVSELAAGAPPLPGAIDVPRTEEAAFVTAQPRVVEEIVLERRAETRTAPVHTTLKHSEVNVQELGRSDMNPLHQTTRASSPNAAKVAVTDTARGGGHGLDRPSAAHGTLARARSFPVSVLLLLVVLAIALIALIAAIF